MFGYEISHPQRPIHRDGQVFRAEFRAATIVSWLADIPMFNGTFTSRAVVRCSTFMPIRGQRAQVLCLAVKLVPEAPAGATQDLLFFSSWEKLRVHVVPSWPAEAVGTVFSTAMAYRVGQQRIVFGARVPVPPDSAPPPSCGSAWKDVVAMMDTPKFELEILTALAGRRWWHAGVLTGFTRYGPGGDSLRYRPGTTSPELALSNMGWWRDSVYGYFQSRP